MSAGVSDQRMKGQGNQVSNGPKDHVNEHEDFDSWRTTQHHQGYNTPISTSMASDPYSMSNYYGTSFPYQAFGVGDGTWSNGGDPMTFLSGYGGQMGHDSYSMDGMFGGGGAAAAAGFGTAFGQPAQPTPGFNYFHGNGDYSTWGGSAAAPAPAAAPMTRKPYEDYYRATEGMYGEGLKGVDQGMQGLGLSEAAGNGGGGQVKVPDGGKDPSKVQEGKEASQQAGVAAPPKKMTWASIAGQPAKPQPPVAAGGAGKKKGPGMPPPPMVPGKHNMDIGTWEGKNGGGGGPKQPVGPPVAPGGGGGRQPAWGAAQARGGAGGPRAGAGGAPPNGGVAYATGPPHHPVAVALPGPHHPPQQHPHPHHHHPHHHHPHHHPQPPSAHHPLGGGPPAAPAPAPLPNHPVLDELRVKNNYNPADFDLSAKGARFFVIKSYSEDDIHRSIKYEIWCSTEHGNKRLDQAFRERETKGGGGPVYLFFSVNGSGHFCGMAQMSSPVDYNASSSVWSQDKWKGQFRVRWIYVKDVPNTQLRQIRLENNENKPVTNSRDTQEVPLEKGRQVLRILHTYRHSTSIFDDFVHYEKRQEEEDSRKGPEGPAGGQGQQQGGGGGPRPPPQQQGPPGGQPDRGGHSMPPPPPPHKDRGDGGSSRGRGTGRGGRN